MKNNPEIEVVCTPRPMLGECPIWNANTGCLEWIDARLKAFYRLESDGRVQRWSLPKRIGSWAAVKGGGYLAAMEDGLYSLDLFSVGGEASFRRNLILDAEPDKPNNRANDGKCDSRGRFWFSSRGESSDVPAGSLYRYDGSSCKRMIDGIICPNGVAFSPDGRTMMLADTEAETLWIYDVSLEDGEVSNKRLFFSTVHMPGQIDGAAFDTEGGYWCAFLRHSMIARFDPKGRIDRMVHLPTRYPTMCCFGGEKRDVMYVTSSSIHAKAEGYPDPLAGSVLAIHGLGVAGIPEPMFEP